MVDRWQQRFAEWCRAKQAYDILQEEVENTRALYQKVLLAMRETDLLSHNKVNDIWIVDAAEVPVKPVRPRIVLTLVLAVGSGLSLVLAGWWVKGSAVVS